MTTTKLLNESFSSLADAVLAYMQHNGFEDRDGKKIDPEMVKHFCSVNLIPIIALNSTDLSDDTSYYPTTRWLKEFIERYKFLEYGHGDFIYLDKGNRPIGFLSVSDSSARNIFFSFTGDRDLGEILFEEAKKNIRFDQSEEVKPDYIEIVALEGMSRAIAGELAGTSRRLDNIRVAKDAYYPYLDGGVKGLITEFLKSEESVLVIKGKPGTGKSSAISAALTDLNLKAIYGKDTNVINNPGFVNKIFATCDQYLAALGGSKAKVRGELFEECILLEEAYKSYYIPSPYATKEKTEQMPLIVIEDADILLAPRSTGNKVMAELLNATDGIGSSFDRKVIFTTNLTDIEDIDEALIRPGRCFDVLDFRYLTPMEAIEARYAAGLPPFLTVPTEDLSLAEALRKPRKRVYFKDGVAELVNSLKH